MIKDFVNDPGHQLLHRIAIKYDLPDYVKEAQQEGMQEKTASAEIGSSCALLAPEPRLPCHNKAATYLSYAYFLEQRNELDDIDRRKCSSHLDLQVNKWGISKDVEALEIQHSAIEKQAGETNERYPLRNPEEVEAARNFLIKQSDAGYPDIDFHDRVDLADRLLKHYPDSPLLRKTSCKYGCYDGKKVAEVIRSKAPENETAEQLAQLCEKLSGMEMQEQHKTAALIADAAQLFNDHAAELVLAVNSPDDVVELSNGAVVTKTAIEKVESDVLDAQTLQTPVIGRWSDRRKHACGMMGPDLASILMGDLGASGLSAESGGEPAEIQIITIKRHAGGGGKPEVVIEEGGDLPEELPELPEDIESVEDAPEPMAPEETKQD